MLTLMVMVSCIIAHFCYAFRYIGEINVSYAHLISFSEYSLTSLARHKRREQL